MKNATKAMRTDPQTQNTQLLFFSTIGKGPNRQNVTILFDEESTFSVKVLSFKLRVGSKNRAQRSYLIKAGYFIKPEVSSVALKLSELEPGEVEESAAKNIFEPAAELGNGNNISRSTVPPLLKMNTAVLMLHEKVFADKSSSIDTTGLMNGLVSIMSGVLRADSRTFKPESLQRV